MNAKTPISLLFVCMGNICRSPTAEGVFRHFVKEHGLADQILVDSAGTHAYHVGEAPDRRAVAAALRRGYVLNDIRARRIAAADFETFDYVLAMDRVNLQALREIAAAEYHSKIRLFLEFSTGQDGDVPDPYYGAGAGFEYVLDLVEDASNHLLAMLVRNRSA